MNTRSALPNREILVALGANLGQRRENLEAALRELEKHFGRLSISKLYTTRALILPGSEPSPEYFNAAVSFESDASCEDILNQLQSIESEIGRDRSVEQRWGARLIDLDLICAGNEIVDGPRLTIPHKEVGNRDFVLLPLMDIAPAFRHPILGVTFEQLYVKLLSRNLETYVIKSEDW